MLSSWTGHGMIFSTAAMDALRIRDTATDPPGGWFERDAKQHLTGKMFEYAGWNAERRLADTVSDADAIEQLKTFSDQSLAFGITSIQNMSMLPLARYEKIERHGPAAIRIRMIRFPMTENGRVTEGTQPVGRGQGASALDHQRNEVDPRRHAGRAGRCGSHGRIRAAAKPWANSTSRPTRSRPS